jgi:hypothetical protein
VHISYKYYSDEPEFQGNCSILLPRQMSKLVLHLLSPIRNILDVIEPRHPRQILPRGYRIPTAWSYWFSMIKWSKFILYITPSFKRQLSFLETLFHWKLQELLAWLDDPRIYVDGETSVVFLNLVYEGFCSMEYSPLVDDIAKEHIHSALQYHISHLYCKMFTTGGTASKLQRQNILFEAGMFSLFAKSSDLLPLGNDKRMSNWYGRGILSAHKRASANEKSCRQEVLSRIWKHSSLRDF